jgi:hypothetical protein
LLSVFCRITLADPEDVRSPEKVSAASDLKKLDASIPSTVSASRPVILALVAVMTPTLRLTTLSGPGRAVANPARLRVLVVISSTF